MMSSCNLGNQQFIHRKKIKKKICIHKACIKRIAKQNSLLIIGKLLTVKQLKNDIDDLVQDCSTSSANPLELLQSFLRMLRKNHNTSDYKSL